MAAGRRVAPVRRNAIHVARKHLDLNTRILRQTGSCFGIAEVLREQDKPEQRHPTG